MNRLNLTLTTINLALLITLLTSTHPPAAHANSTADPLPILRARGLEIVDDQGRVRALLAVQPPTTVDGKAYPETVLFRLVDPTSGPVVKLTAAINGSALMLSDDAQGGIQLQAKGKGSQVQVTSKEGQKAILKP